MRSPPPLCQQDEALDLVHWYRQLLGVAMGVAWGALNMPGLLGFLGCARARSMGCLTCTRAR